MANYNTDDNNNFGEQTTSTSGTLENLGQQIAHIELKLQHKKRIKKLRTGELDREDLDVIPFYSPDEWESYEQYDRIVGNPLSKPDPEEIDEILEDD